MLYVLLKTVMFEVSSWPLVVLDYTVWAQGECCDQRASRGVSRKAWSGPGLSSGDFTDIMDSSPASVCLYNSVSRVPPP